MSRLLARLAAALAAMIVADSAGQALPAGGPEGADTQTAEETVAWEGIDVSGLPQLTPETYPKVDGSTATLPISYALYRICTGASEEEAEEAIAHSKTDYAYYGLSSDYDNEYATRLVIAYEPSDEIYDHLDQYAGDLDFRSIGKDALVFLANVGNPVENLSEEQLIDIYTGRIRNWKELGGEDMEILAFQRSANSGSQTLMENLVLRGQEPMPAPAYMVPSEMGELIEKVSGYSNADNAIGYSVYFYARNMYSVPNLRFMSVNGVMPSNGTIQSGEYPYTNDFYAVIREEEPEDSPARQIADWLVSRPGQELIAALGYVPASEEVAAEEEAPQSYAAITFERGEAAYELEEDQVILLNGDDYLNHSGLTALDGEMNEIAVWDDLYLKEDVLVQTLEEPVVVVSREAGGMGVYRLDTDEWILEPDYSSVSYNRKDDYYQGSRYDYTTRIYDEALLVDGILYTTRSGPEEDTSGYLWATGDHVWIEEEKNEFSIMDREGNLVKTLDAADIAVQLQASAEETGFEYSGESPVPAYWYYSLNYIFAELEGGGTATFDETGKLVVSPAMITDALKTSFGIDTSSDNAGYSLSALSDTPDGLLICGYAYGNDESQDFLYNAGTGEMLSAKGDEVVGNSDYYGTGEMSFTVKSGETADSVIYCGGSEPLVSSDGTPFMYSMGKGYYAWWKDGILTVEDREGSEHFELNVEKQPETQWELGNAVGKDLFILRDDEENSMSLYRGEELVIKADYVFELSSMIGGDSSRFDGYTVIQFHAENIVAEAGEETGEYGAEGNIIFDGRTGEEVFRTENGEYVSHVNAPVVTTSRDYFVYFRTMDGGLVMKTRREAGTSD